MSLTTLAALAVIAASLVAVVYFVQRMLTRPVRDAAETVTGVAGELGGTARHAVDAVGKAVEPVGRAAGRIGEAIAERLRTRRVELHQLRAQVAELSSETERLRARRINVDQVRAVLKLALIEAEESYTDFEKSTLSDIEGALKREAVEYLGVMQVRYTQRLGVDLEKLRFQLLPEREIAVAGLGQTEIIGIHSLKPVTLHAELRRHRTLPVLGESSEILATDPGQRLHRSAADQTSRMLEAIQNSSTTRAIDAAIEKLALSFLQSCFAPAGYGVVPAAGELTEPRTFFGVCEEVNREIDALLGRHEQQVRALTARADRVEAELGEIADDAAQQLEGNQRP